MRTILVVIVGLLLVAGAVTVGHSAGTVRAYVLMEMTPGQPTWLDEHTGSIGFGMCKGLYRSLWPNEAILHLECQDLESLNQTIVREVPKLKGVTRVMTGFVIKN